MTEYLTDRIVGDPGNPIVRIASMICDPQNHVVERFKDAYSTGKTATSQPETELRIQWNYVGQPNVDPTKLQLPLTDFAFFSFRDAVRNVVYSAVQPAVGAFYNYIGVFNNSNTFGISTNDELALEPMYFLANPSLGNWKPHGAVLGVGKALGRVGVWIDAIPSVAAATATFTLGEAIVGANSMTLSSYKYNAGRWIQGLTATATTGDVTIQVSIPASGYYSFDISNRDSINHTFQAFEIESNSNLGTAWAHLGLNQLMPQNAPNIQQMRLLGVSAWLQNNASPLVQQGTLVAAQLNAGEDWYASYAAQPNCYNAIAAVDDDKQRRLEKGYYGFLKSSKREDFNFQTPFVGLMIGAGGGTVNTMPVSATFELDTPHDYLGVAASCSVQGGGDANITVATAVEFRTQNDWFGQQQATTSIRDWEEAIAATSSMQQHYDNEVHVYDILRTLGTIGGYVGPALALFGPQGAAAGSAIAGLSLGARTLGNYLERNKRKAEALQATEALARMQPGGGLSADTKKALREAVKKLRHM